MNKKMVSVMLIFLIAGFSAGYLHFLISTKLRTTETCTASVVVFHKGIQANFTFDFMYNKQKKNGVVSVSGRLHQTNRFEGTIRRDISYTWAENRNTYKFLSASISKIDNAETLPDDVIATVLPAFYVYANKEVNYSIKAQGNSGFLFTVGKRPLFICAH
ncbi:hypothetical protein Q5705_08655 [Kosakonia sp. H02]|nr:hypothetical protein Q5705_08655 [Kosakonia sp. H02]